MAETPSNAWKEKMLLGSPLSSTVKSLERKAGYWGSRGIRHHNIKLDQAQARV